MSHSKLQEMLEILLVLTTTTHSVQKIRTLTAAVHSSTKGLGGTPQAFVTTVILMDNTIYIGLMSTVWPGMVGEDITIL